MKYEWTKIEQDSFDENKWIVAHNNLLTYPNFNEEFKINTYASKFQLGLVISQKCKPITLYSRTLTHYQKGIQ